MMNNEKIAILCNNRIAIPAIQTLWHNSKLSFVAVPESNTEMVDFLTGFGQQTGLELLFLNQQQWHHQLKNEVLQHKPGAIFLMTFPWKIPEDLLQEFPKRFYNFHYGLLPEMRGVDPIFESIRAQQSQTGITVHAVEKGLDKGGIVLKKIIPIGAFATHGMLTSGLSVLGANILPELLMAMQATPVPQDESKARYYKRPGLKEVCIDWNEQDAASVDALTRACNPWNKGAYTSYNGMILRIVEASLMKNTTEDKHKPGLITIMNEKEGLFVCCKNNTTLKVNILYTDDGFFTSDRFHLLGLKAGGIFSNAS